MAGFQKRKIVFIGGGGHCSSVIDSAIASEQFEYIVYTDSNILKNFSILGMKCAGTDDELPRLFSSGYTNAFASMGSIKDTSVRRNVYKKTGELDFVFPSIVDPSALVALETIIEEGVFIGKRAVINTGSKICSFAIINTGAIIEHNCSIGELSHVSVGAVVCGDCVIENDVFVGVNSTVIQGVIIGANSIIGAGSVVLSDVPNNTTVVGIWGVELYKIILLVTSHTSWYKRCLAC